MCPDVSKGMCSIALLVESDWPGRGVKVTIFIQHFRFQPSVTELLSTNCCWEREGFERVGIHLFEVHGHGSSNVATYRCNFLLCNQVTSKLEVGDAAN